MFSFGPLRDWWSNWWPRPSLGEQGERIAARYLRRRGHTIIARGLRLPLGELDLITVDGSVVVFVEVKTRTSQDGGHPAEAVDRHKQQRVTRAALSYLQRHDLLDCATRFDVVAITWPAGNSKPVVEHLVGAFEAVGPRSMFT